VSKNRTLVQPVQTLRNLMQKMTESPHKKSPSELLAMKVIKSTYHLDRRREVPRVATEVPTREAPRVATEVPTREVPRVATEVPTDRDRVRDHDHIQDQDLGQIQALVQDLQDHRLHPGRTRSS